MLPQNYVHFRNIFKQFCMVNNNGMEKGKRRAWTEEKGQTRILELKEKVAVT